MRRRPGFLRRTIQKIREAQRAKVGRPVPLIITISDNRPGLMVLDHETLTHNTDAQLAWLIREMIKARRTRLVSQSS